MSGTSDQSPQAQALLERVRAHVREELRPLAEDIDRKRLYPEGWLREMGELGGFAALAPVADGGSGLGLATQIAAVGAVGEECGATAFMAWCQATCAWYLLKSSNRALRERLLGDVLHARLLAGTGMSNTVKHLSGLEQNRLQAVRTEGGFTVRGTLPWVSNIGAEHAFGVTAQVADGDGGGYVMFIARGNAPGVSLRACPEFCAHEGTNTLGVRFDNAHIADTEVLAQPAEFADYLARVKGGFMLLQSGMGLGLVQSCLEIMRDANLFAGEQNAFLDDTHDALQAELARLQARTMTLADAIDAGRADMLEVLRARAECSELSLRAAQSAALHCGAKGFVMRHPAQRRTREAMFVAIITPSLRHLRKEIDAIERQRAGA